MHFITSLPWNENTDFYKNGLLMWQQRTVKLYTRRYPLDFMCGWNRLRFFFLKEIISNLQQHNNKINYQSDASLVQKEN